MKKTTLPGFLVFVLVLGIVAMSFTGCEGPTGATGAAGGPGPAGPAGEAGANSGSVPVFMQGTWKTEGTVGSSWTFTADRAKFASSSVTSWYDVILLSFVFDLNGTSGTKGDYPGGYKMTGMQVNGGAMAGDNNKERTVSFYFNSALDAFVIGDGTLAYQKQPQ